MSGVNYRMTDSDRSSSQPLGGSTRRKDALDKVTGRAQYVEDLPAEGVLHVRVLRRQCHHGRLLKLDMSRAARLQGIRCVLTAKDIPGVNGFPDYSVEEPVLTPVGATLRMRGAPIALVIAESGEQAQAGLDAVEVEIEPLPCTFDMEEALEPGAVKIAGECNELSRFELKRGNVGAALASSEHVVETTYTTAFLEHTALERESLWASANENGQLTVIGGTHQPHAQRRYIAAMLNMCEESVRVIVPPMGGSFGGKQDPWPFAAVALAAYHAGQPVRLVYSRREVIEATPKRHPYRLQYKIGANAAGELTGLSIHIDCNTGGYDGAGRFIPNYALTAAGGAYRWQAVDGMARTIYTNGPKSGQFRGFGTSQSTFGLECALDELIQKRGDNPIDFRLENCIGEVEDTFLGYPVGDSLGYREVLESLRADYGAFTRDADVFNRNHVDSPFRRGVGLAGMWYRFGKAGSLKIPAEAELAIDGHPVVYCSAPEYGQGISTVMSQIAAEAWGGSRERVEIVNADTAQVLDSDVQGASRATFFVGGAVRQAVLSLKQQVFEVAAEMLVAADATLKLKGEHIVVLGSEERSVALAEVAHEFDRRGLRRRFAASFDISSAFAGEPPLEYAPLFITGAHLAEVQVDMETGITEVLKVVAAHDVGKAVNPQGATGQIEGAIVMGMGAALYEEFVPGQTVELSHYQVPVSVSVPDIKVILVEVPSRLGPYGVKGLGEAPLLPSTPAIINAVSRAIGCRIRSVPATPERIVRAIQTGAA